MRTLLFLLLCAPTLALADGFSGSGSGSNTPVVCVFEGDSLTQAATNPNNWPGVLVTLAPKWRSASAYNVAVTSETVDQMITEYATEVAPHAPRLTQDGYFFLLAGVNNLGNGDSGATTYARLKTEWASARADGFKVVAFTIHPNLQSYTNTTRVDLNVLIRSDPTLYDYLIELDALFTNPSDATLSTDGTHFTAAGYARLAREVDTKLSGGGVRSYFSSINVDVSTNTKALNTSNSGITIKNHANAAQSTTNIDWSSFYFSSNVLYWETQKNGSGTARDMVMAPGGTERARVNAASGGFSIGTSTDAGAGTLLTSNGNIIGSSGIKSVRLRHGTATLVTGTATISDTTTTADTRILINRMTDGGTVGASYSVSRSAGASFTVTSKDGSGSTQSADTSIVAYEMIEP